MTASGVFLYYQLYIDASMTQVWGDGTSGTYLLSTSNLIPIVGGSMSYPVYMKITALQNDGPATYTDSAATATVNY